MAIINRQTQKNTLIGQLAKLPPTDGMWADLIESMASLPDPSTFTAEQKFDAGLDVTGGQLKVGGVPIITDGGISKSIPIPFPTASENTPFFFTDVAITVSKLVFVLEGTSPTATITITHDLDASAAGTEIVTGGTDVTSETTGDVVTTFDDATIPANSFVRIKTTAVGGTNDLLFAQLFAMPD